MTKPTWQKPSQSSGASSIPESTKQSSFPKSSYRFGESRRHLKRFNSSLFFPEPKFAPKSSWQFISDLFFYASLAVVIAMTLWQLHIFSAQAQKSTGIYDEIAQIVSNQFHSELRNNPEFAKVIKGAL